MPGPIHVAFATLVVVQLGGVKAPRDHVEAMLQACGEAVQGRCVMDPARSATVEPDREVTVHAEVRWRREHAAAEISAGAEGAAVTHRTMTFEGTESLEERWRSVGLALGVMSERVVGAALVAAPRSADDVQPTGTEEEQSERAPHSDAPAPRATTTVDALTVFGPGLDNGSWRVGGALRAAHRLNASAWWFEFGLAGARSSLPSDDVSLISTQAFAGIAHSWDFERFTARARAGGLVDLLAAESGRLGVAPRSGRSLDAGILVGLDAAYSLTRWLAVVALGQVEATGRDTAVRVEGEAVGRTGFVVQTFGAGLRLQLGEQLGGG